MSSHKDHSKLEQVKEAVQNSDLNENEKTETIKRLEEWIAEDKAEGIIYEELVELAAGIKPMLAELGLIN
jgi:hypothetical protein